MIEGPSATRRRLDGVDFVLAGHGLGFSQLAQYPGELLFGQPLRLLVPEVEQEDVFGALIWVVVRVRPHSLAEQRSSPQSLPDLRQHGVGTDGRIDLPLSPRLCASTARWPTGPACILETGPEQIRRNVSRRLGSVSDVPQVGVHLGSLDPCAGWRPRNRRWFGCRR